MSIFENDPPDDLLDDEIPPDDYGDDDVDVDQDLAGAEGDENIDSSPQDPTKPAKNAQDPKAAKPNEQPKLTPQEIEAKYAELQAESELLKPYKELNDQYGGYEAIQPAIDLYGMLTGGEFNAPQALELMSVLNPEAVRAIGWQLIDNEQQAIINDPKIRDAVLASDENYQRFLKWQETGELPTDENIDPALKKVQEELAQFKKQEADKQAAQAKADEEAKVKRTQEAVQAYDNAQLKWVDEQIAALKWGEEYKDDLEEVKDLALGRFNNDEKARQALDHARILSLRSKANPKDTRLKQLFEAANKRVKHIFTQKLKPIVERRNKHIQGTHAATQAQRAKQAAKPVLGNNGANISPKDALSGLSNADMYTRAQARLDKARAQGTVQGYDGY